MDRATTTFETTPIQLFLVTAVATLWWLAHLWKSNHAEISPVELVVLLLHVAAVLLVEYVLLVALVKRIRGAAPIANALFCTFNLFTLVLIHGESVAQLSRLWSTLLLLGIFAGFAVFFTIVRRHSLAQRAALVMLGVLAVVNVAQYSWGSVRGESHGTTSLPSYLTYPHFEETPNVYFILFDSMIPQAIAERLLGVEGELLYVRVLREAGFRMLENVFADRVPTKASVNALVSMDLGYYQSLDRATVYGQAIGATPAPLYEVFRRNGYKTQLFYSTNYFGPRSKSRLDHYGVANPQGICEHIDSRYALLGYCLLDYGRVWRQRYPAMLFERIRDVGGTSEQWLTVAYIYSPGHTPKTFDPYDPAQWKTYAEQFATGARKASGYMRELLETLKQHDPDAVVVILGDHGTWVSRGLLPLPEDSPLSEVEVLLDRHAVLGAVYPPGFCADEFESPTGLAQIARAVVKCLAGGVDPLPPDYQPEAGRFDSVAYE